MGSALSIISSKTFDHICKQGGQRVPLETSSLVLTDFQHCCVPIRGEAIINVQFKEFKGPLSIVVVEGQRTSLLGLDWFEALGISVTNIHRTQIEELARVCQQYANVFSLELGQYMGAPISFNLDPMVTPIRLKLHRVPFALKPKIDAEFDKLVQQGVL